jgi:hypothetical protein
LSEMSETSMRSMRVHAAQSKEAEIHGCDLL